MIKEEQELEKEGEQEEEKIKQEHDKVNKLLISPLLLAHLAKGNVSYCHHLASVCKLFTF